MQGNQWRTILLLHWIYSWNLNQKREKETNDFVWLLLSFFKSFLVLMCFICVCNVIYLHIYLLIYCIALIILYSGCRKTCLGPYEKVYYYIWTKMFFFLLNVSVGLQLCPSFKFWANFRSWDRSWNRHCFKRMEKTVELSISVFQSILPGDLHDMVSLAEDDAWRRIRNILSPSFSSSRIKEVQVTHLSSKGYRAYNIFSTCMLCILFLRV